MSGGWNALNELIRSDHTWAIQAERPLHEQSSGTFSDVSGVSD
jgi:hypothetical protein